MRNRRFLTNIAIAFAMAAATYDCKYLRFIVCLLVSFLLCFRNHTRPFGRHLVETCWSNL